MLDITNKNTWNGIEIILICHFNRKSNVLKQRLKQCCYLNLSEIHNIEVYSMKCFWILNKTSLIENWSVVWCLLLHWCWWDLERKEQSKLMTSLVCTLIALICKLILRLDQNWILSALIFENIRTFNILQVFILTTKGFSGKFKGINFRELNEKMKK